MQRRRRSNAIEHGAPGVYNVVDDEPVAVATWLPELAEAVGAKPPRRVPVWLGRLAAGEVGVSMMTQIRGTSNAKAKRELAWQPRYRTYREGFRNGLGDVPVPVPSRTRSERERTAPSGSSRERSRVWPPPVGRKARHWTRVSVRQAYRDGRLGRGPAADGGRDITGASG
jgi:hypothetical protein